MSSHSASVARKLAATLASASLLVAPASARASPETLKRAMTNIFYAPFDMVLSPLTAADTVIHNIRYSDDSIAARVAFAVPGYGWLAGLDFAGGALRGIAGALEFLPGIVLYPFEADLDPLFDPADRSPALVDIENPLADSHIMSFFPLLSSNPRFGIDYTTTE